MTCAASDIILTRLFEKRKYTAGWSSLVARWAHNPKVRGSNPLPATTKSRCTRQRLFLCILRVSNRINEAVMPMFTVYVLRSVESFRYTGQCVDFPVRLQQHNTKSLGFWTRRGNDWVPTYLETYASRQEAISRERWLKSGAGRRYLNSHEAIRWDP